MNFKLSFEDRARVGFEQLSKQEPVTLEMARKQAGFLSTKSDAKVKKQAINKPPSSPTK